VIQIKMRYRNF